MTLATYFASNPAGQRLVALVELSHPTWADSLLYAEDVQDWTVTTEDARTLTFPSTGFNAENAQIADSGDDTRDFTLPDVDGALWDRIEAAKGYVDETNSPVPIVVTLRLYLSDELNAPAAVLPGALSKPERDADGLAVSFSASNADLVNFNAPHERYTWLNSPGLRR